MVNKMFNSQNNSSSRLSMRHSLMVWVAGAVLGWVVAVMSVWTALSTPSNGNIAENSPSQAEQMEQMEQIMPAAGKQKETEKSDN